MGKENVERAIFNKYDLRDFLNLLKGESGTLDRGKVERWNGFICHIVSKMKEHYKEVELRLPFQGHGLSFIEYYGPDWRNIEEAADVEKLSIALEGLLKSINQE